MYAPNRARFDVSHLQHLRDGRDDMLQTVGGLLDLRTGLYLPGIAGGARGANDFAQVWATTDGVTFDVLWDELQLALEYYNQRTPEFIDRFTYRTRQSGWKNATGSTMRWEKGTEYGRPFRQTIRPTFTLRGLPVNDYQFGLMYTRKYLLRASRDEIAATLNEVMRSDQENQLMEILRALLSDVSYTFEDEETSQVLNVLAFYNGDAEVPPMFGGRTFTAPHTHYHATNGALADADILQMKEDLVEHGHDRNRELWIAANLEDDVRALTDAASEKVFYPNWFYENPNIQMAPADTQRTAVNLGPEFIGMIDGFRVRVERLLPDNYMFGFNNYGSNSALNPLAYRERRNDAEVGLQLVNEDGGGTFPIVNSFYLRSFGVAALNRSNFTATFVDAGAAYVDPTASFPSAT